MCIRDSYKGGLVTYLEVTTAQSAALSNEITAVNILTRRIDVYKRQVPGVAAYLTMPQYPGRRFPGKLVRSSEAIEMASRTLLVEVDVANPTGEILPGAYSEVHFKLPSPASTVVIPVTSLIFRSEGLRVAVVRNARAVMVPITLGRDFGTEVEVVSGLDATEKVVTNPPDSLVDGQEVRSATAGAGS